MGPYAGLAMGNPFAWEQLEGSALVVGQGGIGRAIISALRQKAPQLDLLAAGRSGPYPLDICSNESLERLKDDLQGRKPLRLVFNCSGWLHQNGRGPEKRLQAVSRAGLEQSFAVNAFAPILLAKAVEAALGHGSPCWFASLSARVGSIGDNQLGGWYSYRAAKAAQNQLLRCLAIEWQRKRPAATVVLLHPGTTATQLSEPFSAGVAADKLFKPAKAAEQLLAVLAQQTPANSGCFLAWDGKSIPW
jgi:NAD(P)-dependent dehydrogenase (short-subunit alcohol dehydrogenase family)